MTLPILLIQHTNTTSPGHVLPWLAASGRPFKHIRLHKGDPLPAPEAVSAVILCGGGVHVDQEDQYPWLKPEKKFLEATIGRGTKVVGLCLGGQLCGQILGAKVYPHPNGWEIGWQEVSLKAIPGLPGFEKEESLIFSQYHRYIFDLPSGARSIATNAWWDVQAFEWNNQVIGFQFHPERDAAGYKALAKEPHMPKEGIVHSPKQILELGDLYEPNSRKWFFDFLDGFFI